MERTKLLTVAVIGLLLLNLLTIGFLVVRPDRPTYPDQRSGPPMGEGPANVIIERLHFDATQQEKYRQLVTAHQHQTRALSDQMVQLHRNYYELLASDQSDSAKANSLSNQIANNQRAQAQLNFDHFKQIKALCRPDQQADFTNLVRDLAHLFGRHQRAPSPGAGGPPDGPPENLPPGP